MFPLLCSAVVLAAASPAPPSTSAACGAQRCEVFDSPQDAFQKVLATKPAVVGIGEFHQLEGGPNVPSAMKRFTELLLPLLGGRASDLLVETWITDGKCGEVEAQVTEEIREEIERPPETENEVVTMALRARELGIVPDILRLTCKDYRGLHDKNGELDNEKLLMLVARLLAQQGAALHKRNAAARRDALVVIYGGALHNDQAPDKDVADFCFGPALARRTRGRYVELDLLVPEYVENDEDVRKESWFPFLRERAATDRALLITRGPRSFVLVLPRTAPAVTAPPPAPPPAAPAP